MLWWTISETRYDKYATGIGWLPSFRIQQNLNDCQWWRDCRLQLFSVGKSNASCIEFNWSGQQQYFSFLTKNTQRFFDPISFLKDQKEVRKCYRQHHVTFRRVGHLMCVTARIRDIGSELDQIWCEQDCIWIQNSDISGILCCIKKSDIIDLISCNKTQTEFGRGVWGGKDFPNELWLFHLEHKPLLSH